MTAPKNNGKNYTVEEKLEILAAAKGSGLKEAAAKYHVSKASIYNWRKQHETQGADGLQDGRSSNIGGKPVPDWKRIKVLAVKETDPGFGASQIRNQLRREGTTISIESIRAILKEAGFAVERRHAGQKEYLRFEASRPLELTQIDICEFHVHKQKVYLVLLLDDYSRFLLKLIGVDRNFDFAGVKKIEEIILCQAPHTPFSERQAIIRPPLRFLSAGILANQNLKIKQNV